MLSGPGQKISHAERAEQRRQESARRAAEWLSDREAELNLYVPPTWTPEWVEFRLLEAAKVMVRGPGGRIGPTKMKSFGRNYFHTEEEAQALRLLEEGERKRERLKPPNAIEIQRADQVDSWISDVMPRDAETTTILLYWALWTATDRDIDIMVARYYFASRRRFYDKRAKGLITLAEALNLRGEAVS